jgi:hypothetical protein
MIYLHSFLGNGITEHYFYDESNSEIYVVLHYDDERIEEVMYCLGDIDLLDITEKYYKDYILPVNLRYIDYDNRHNFKDSLLYYILDNI